MFEDITAFYKALVENQSKHTWAKELKEKLVDFLGAYAKNKNLSELIEKFYIVRDSIHANRTTLFSIIVDPLAQEYVEHMISAIGYDNNLQYQHAYASIAGMTLVEGFPQYFADLIQMDKSAKLTQSNNNNESAVAYTPLVKKPKTQREVKAEILTQLGNKIKAQEITSKEDAVLFVREAVEKTTDIHQPLKKGFLNGIIPEIDKLFVVHPTANQLMK